MEEIRRSLTRQSWLMAGACVYVDLCVLLAQRAPGHAVWRISVVLVLTVVADVKLAGGPRSAELVTFLQAGLLVATPVLLPDGHYLEIPIGSGQMVATYQAGAWLSCRRAVRALTVMIAAMPGYLMVGDSSLAWLLTSPPALGVLILAIVVLPWTVGRYNASYQARLSRLELMAERRERDERAAVEQAIATERSAIARDLHDMISHHVSASAMHAGVARMGLPDGMDSTLSRALSAVESSSRSALSDLHRLLDMLHDPDSAQAPGRPGIRDLDDLLDQMRAAGLVIRRVGHGDLPPLPARLDASLYMILLEALTNALRHGDGRWAQVMLCRRQSHVVAGVNNPIPAGGAVQTPGDGQGHGLNGIRRRAELLGGGVVWGPYEHGRRWLLCVSLPMDGSADEISPPAR